MPSDIQERRKNIIAEYDATVDEAYWTLREKLAALDAEELVPLEDPFPDGTILHLIRTSGASQVWERDGDLWFLAGGEEMWIWSQARACILDSSRVVRLDPANGEVLYGKEG